MNRKNKKKEVASVIIFKMLLFLVPGKNYKIRGDTSCYRWKLFFNVVLAEMINENRRVCAS